MSAMQGALSAAERSMRSVFVGNIPYEATEEQLKDIFAEVGPVVSFRLVYDRETGKPKGYGFCEYKDQEMALSAMRNLNSYELNGRALRVDNAASEKSKEELKNLQASLGGPPVESPYGPDVGSEKAPEAISKIMCSLPPEQLYELMIQMKMCIENNPNEARNLLIQNPQLSYALLQAQVIMKMVEPEVALTMLHRPGFQPPPPGALLPTPDTKTAPVPTTAPPTTINETPASYPSAMPPAPVGSMQQNSMMPTPRLTQPVVPLTRPALLGERPALIPERPPLVAPNPINQNSFPERARFPQPRMPTGPQQNRWTAPDPRVLGDHDLRPIPMTDRDMRAPPTLGGDKDMRQSGSDQDLRAMGATGAVPENRSFDPRFRNMPAPDTQAVQGGRPGPDMRPMQGPDMRPMQGPDMRPMQGPDMRPMQGPDMRPMQGPDMRPMQGQEMRPMQGQEMRPMQGQDMRPMSGPDMRPMQGPDMRSQQGPDVRNMSGLNPYDGRTAPTTSVRIEDQRVPGPLGSSTLSGPRAPQNPRIAAVSGGSPAIGSGSPNTTSSPRPANPLAAAAAAIAPHDQEKAALIMQVLQLSDQQIAMLPPEQRQSIMILKQQIARSQQI